MSTDHRGRPLQSQAGAVPHLNRFLRPLSDEKLYGPGHAEMSREEKDSFIRELMGETEAPDESIYTFPRGLSVPEKMPPERPVRSRIMAKPIREQRAAASRRAEFAENPGLAEELMGANPPVDSAAQEEEMDMLGGFQKYPARGLTKGDRGAAAPWDMYR